MKLVYQLANPKKPVVGWLSTLPMDSRLRSAQRPACARPGWCYSEAQQLFDVRPLEANATKIDPDINVLVLVHPKNLSPATQFAIDQYALRGGHILAVRRPARRVGQLRRRDPQNPMAAMSADKSSHLEALLNAWGVQFDPGQVVADRGHALSVTMRQGEPPVEHLGVLGLEQGRLRRRRRRHRRALQRQRRDRRQSRAGEGREGALRAAAAARAPRRSCCRSSASACCMDPASLLDGFKPTGQRYTLGARVTGNVQDRLSRRAARRA